jgi:modulator of FtsH protease HflK
MVRYLFALIALAFLAWTASTALTQVRPGERAVVRRFGRIVTHEQKLEPGLYVGWPWGIEQVDREKVSFARRLTVGFTDKSELEDEVVPAGQMLTGDHNLVNVEAAIHYRIREADVELFVLQKDQAEAFVARVAETLLAEWIAGRRVDDVLLRGKIDLPGFLRAELPARLKDYHLGVEIEQASITTLEPPRQVKEAFERLTQAHENIDTRMNEAKEKAGGMKSEMRAKIYALERQAAAYANEEHVKAIAEAEGFQKRLAQYRELSRSNPDYLNTLWLDETTRLYARMKEKGRIEALDHYLAEGGLSITQFPLQPKKK